MALFRKKVEKPKNYLGSILFRFDNIYNEDLKRFFKDISSGKRMNLEKAGLIISNTSKNLDSVLEDISRKNFKTDYRGDKIRDVIAEMIGELKKYLIIIKECDYNTGNSETGKETGFLESVEEIRILLKRKMKEIESDYL